MKRAIIQDTEFLSQKSIQATKQDYQIVQDLLDTMEAHSEHCVGMAANMIGYRKRIIVVDIEGHHHIMINPEILKTSGCLYEAEEGCLSLKGVRRVKRYERIKVTYLDENFKIKIKSFSGYPAQIIQHEIDHCDGILI